MGWGEGCLLPVCPSFLPTSFSFFYRGASRLPMATYLTLEPAPATTAWLPWPLHPLWVGQVSPSPALRDCMLVHGHVLQTAKGHRHAGFNVF